MCMIQLPIIRGEPTEKLVQPFEEFRRFTRATPFVVAGGDALGRDGTSGGCFPS